MRSASVNFAHGNTEDNDQLMVSSKPVMPIALDTENPTREIERCHRIIEEQECLIQEYRQQGQELTDLVCQLKQQLSSQDLLNARALEYIDHVSHEFRTPLSVILDYLTILNRGFSGKLSHEQAYLLDTISVHTNELVGMVDDILDIRRLDAGVMAMHRDVVDFESVVNKVSQVLHKKAKPRKVQLDIELEAGLPKVFIDAEKVGRVILNLGMNAIKFCGTPGKVRILVADQNDSIRVGVRDNGAGIPPAETTRIFQRFEQRFESEWRSTQGFGLGLGIAKDLVELNFGCMSVSSSSVGGTEFSFTLPVAQFKSVVNAYINYMNNNHPEIGELSAFCLVTSAKSATKREFDGLISRCLHTSEIVMPTPDGWLLLARSNSAYKAVDRIRSLLQRCQEKRAPREEIDLDAQLVFRGPLHDLTSNVSAQLRVL